jgi:hypothetical protein
MFDDVVDVECRNRLKIKTLEGIYMCPPDVAGARLSIP